jgi:ABC-type bacteriocin/lantibiotic exporter with double-glycine peptidase domain
MAIDYDVHYIPQSQAMSCWAASTAMMLGWRNSQCYSEEAVLEEFRHFGTDGASEAECRELATKLGLVSYDGEGCYIPDGWEQILNRGPAAVDIPGHMIVVAGITGDTTPEGSQMHILDPLRGDGWWTFEQFDTAYGGGAGFDLGILQW